MGDSGVVVEMDAAVGNDVSDLARTGCRRGIKLPTGVTACGVMVELEDTDEGLNVPNGGGTRGETTRSGEP